METKEWMSLQEIADELQIPINTIYFYTRNGEGPPVHKFGKHKRVRTEDYKAWLETKLDKHGEIV